jgi:hypothetical protein
MKKKPRKKLLITSRNIHRLSKMMDRLIADGRFDEARSFIKSKETRVDKFGRSRLTWWSAKIEHHAGNRLGAIEILRKATSGEEGYLPHLFYLSGYLIEEGILQDAVATLDRLIRTSERFNDPYFLDEARIMKMYCLRKLGRHDEIMNERAKLPDDFLTMVNDEWVCSGDFN